MILFGGKLAQSFQNMGIPLACVIEARQRKCRIAANAATKTREGNGAEHFLTARAEQERQTIAGQRKAALVLAVKELRQLRPKRTVGEFEDHHQAAEKH